MRTPAEFQNHPHPITGLDGMLFRGVVRHVVDGDTVDVMVDYGFNQYGYHCVRLRGVNTPELVGGTDDTREQARAARDYLRSLLPAGKQVTVRTYKDRQTFGRYLADLLIYTKHEHDDGNFTWKVDDVATAIRLAGYSR